MKQFIIKEFVRERLIAPTAVLDALGAFYTECDWIIRHTEFEYFYATDVGGERLEALAETDTRVSGSELRAILRQTLQIIWGRFTAVTDAPERQTIVDVLDGSLYEIHTNDETVLESLTRHFPQSALLDPAKFRR